MKQLAAILFLTLFLTCSAFAQNRLDVGSTAPLFLATSLDGTTFDMKTLRGSVVVVTFWSTKCEICRNEIPALNRFIDRFDQKDVVFLALTMESEEKLTPYLKANPFKFQIVPDSFGVVMQYADRSKDGRVEMGFPAFFVIDQQGTVQLKISGYDRIVSVATAIDRLLTN